MRCEFDARDQEILDERQAVRKERDLLISLPREGDALLYPDGTTYRVAHSYNDALQPTVGYDASFYFCRSGSLDFSGTLNPSIPNSCFTLIGHEMAPAWFFHHGEVGAHRGVYCNVEVRLWKYTPAT